MKKSQEGDMPAKEHAIDETIDEIIRYRLKGSFTIFLFSVRSNILNSNRVWNS